MTASITARTSIGPYRILYNILFNIDDRTNRVEILRVDHRADVYRNG